MSICVFVQILKGMFDGMLGEITTLRRTRATKPLPTRDYRRIGPTARVCRETNPPPNQQFVDVRPRRCGRTLIVQLRTNCKEAKLGAA
jgi:hypothetical protein